MPTVEKEAAAVPEDMLAVGTLVVERLMPLLTVTNCHCSFPILMPPIVFVQFEPALACPGPQSLWLGLQASEAGFQGSEARRGIGRGAVLS